MTGQRSLYHPSVRIPARVRIEDDSLVWAYDENQDWRRPTDRAVIAFSRLAEAPADQLREFAARYGVLKAARIKPRYQRETDIELPDDSIWRVGTDLAYLVVEGHIEGREPIALWQFLARQMRAILRINAALKGRTRSPLPTVGTLEDWQVFGGTGLPLEDVRDAQFFLSSAVNDWLRFGGVWLELGITEWSRSRTDWKLEISYSGLIGALSYRLLLMVAGESSLYACDGCGQPYIRTKRAPRPGQENFCDDCEGVAQKRATQRYREKGKRA